MRKMMWSSLLLGVSVACASCAGGVRASRFAPHSQFRVVITHSGADDRSYDDVAIIDGETFALGGGDKNVAVLRIKPGLRDVVLESRELKHELASTTQTDPYGQCMPPDCASFLAQTTQGIELAEVPTVICREKLKIQFTDGKTQTARLEVGSHGCIATGGSSTMTY